VTAISSPAALAILGLMALGLGLAEPAAATPPAAVRAVLFTHIEDNTPGGTLGTLQNRNSYLQYRARLIEMADLAHDYDLPWTLQPDWKILRAALLYEDAALMATTNGKNFLCYIKEDLGARIDPHSHEGGGYNYTDVAHLLDSLGVGGSTVIGGHVWDPSLDEFSEWDRFRVPQAGQQYPWASWRGDILMGSGTPNHFNDPHPSGLWRPLDRDHYFVDDPAGNITAVGQYYGTMAGLNGLVELYASGAIPPACLLTSSHGCRPVVLTAPGGLASLEDTLIAPIAALRDAGAVVPTDFTALVAEWNGSYGGVSCVYNGVGTAGVGESPTPAEAPVVRLSAWPNPFEASAVVRVTAALDGPVRVSVFDVAGREVAVLHDGWQAAGTLVYEWAGVNAPDGLYLVRWQGRGIDGRERSETLKVVRAR